MSQAFAINSAGQIVGTYNDSSGHLHGFWAVLEPTGLVLLGTGAVGLLGYAARRRGRPRTNDVD
jgi:hypothetical protein